MLPVFPQLPDVLHQVANHRPVIQHSQPPPELGIVKRLRFGHIHKEMHDQLPVPGLRWSYFRSSPSTSSPEL
jgi:hypothetical protein